MDQKPTDKQPTDRQPTEQHLIDKQPIVLHPTRTHCTYSNPLISNPLYYIQQPIVQCTAPMDQKPTVLQPTLLHLFGEAGHALHAVSHGSAAHFTLQCTMYITLTEQQPPVRDPLKQPPVHCTVHQGSAAHYTDSIYLTAAL